MPGFPDFPDRWAFVRKLVDLQAEDEGLWFESETATEAYLQQELRRLHNAVERASGRCPSHGGVFRCHRPLGHEGSHGDPYLDRIEEWEDA